MRLCEQAHRRASKQQAARSGIEASGQERRRAGDPFSGQAGHAAGRRVRQRGSKVSSPGSEARTAKQAGCVGRAASPVINEQRRMRAGSSTMASASRATAGDLATPDGPGVGSLLGHEFLGQSGRPCSGRGLPRVVAWPACVGSVDCRGSSDGQLAGEFAGWLASRLADRRFSGAA